MIPLPVSEVARLVGGRVVRPAGRAAADPVPGEPAPPDPARPQPDATVTGVVADSRAVRPGDLFAALPGERTDGHLHAAGAVAAGAVAALVTRPVDGVPGIVVDDVLAALGRLARAVLDRLPEVTVVGVTGSVGKTSTKDLLRDVLARFGPVVAPPGSWNNELGLPLTVLTADAATRWLVLEMGARGRGHIRQLCAIAPPRVGVELLVGTSHLGMYPDGPDGLAAAKAELVEALPADGVAVLNADDARVRAMAARTPARVVLVGRTPDAAVRAADVETGPDGRATFTLCAPEGRARVRLRLIGAHQVANALAAAAVGLELGRAAGHSGPELLREVADALAGSGPASRWRMEVATSPTGVTVVNDAYNASPESMRAALDTLAALAGDGRRWAVLGQMAELGDRAAEEHEAVGRHAAGIRVDRLVVVGAEAAGITAGAAGAGTAVVTVPDAAAAARLVRAEASTGDLVLVKGSRVAGLEEVARVLLSAEEPADGTVAAAADGGVRT